MRRLPSVIAFATLILTAGTYGQSAVAPSGADIAGAYDPHKDPKPNPPWLESAEYSRLEGTGIFRASINPKTGSVVTVTPLKSTGYKVLDDAAIVTIRQWQMKPHTWQRIDVPVTYRFYRRH